MEVCRHPFSIRTQPDRCISGNGLVSYYINLILEGVGYTSTNTKAVINGALQVFNLIAAMTGAMLVDKLGRRPLFIISNVGMLIGEQWLFDVLVEDLISCRIDFSCWTITTALFNELHIAAAAKGSSVHSSLNSQPQ